MTTFVSKTVKTAKTESTLVSYHDGALELEAYCARPKSKLGEKKLPAILICHAWAGRDDFVQKKAHDVAALGYLGFALDVYGKGRLGRSKEENSALMTPLKEDRRLLKQRLWAGLEALQQQDQVDGSKIAVMGYCFGGLCALDLARSGAPLRGAVSFHGLLDPPDYPASFSPGIKVLALHGYADPMVPPKQALHFAAEFNTAGIDWQLHAYGQTMHAFTNPQAADPDFGTVYNGLADRRSWQAACHFFEEIFSL